MIHTLRKIEILQPRESCFRNANVVVGGLFKVGGKVYYIKIKLGKKIIQKREEESVTREF